MPAIELLSNLGLFGLASRFPPPLPLPLPLPALAAAAMAGMLMKTVEVEEKEDGAELERLFSPEFELLFEAELEFADVGEDISD